MGKFQYEPESLFACATGNEDVCVQLFSQHQVHYERIPHSSENGMRYQTFLNNIKFIYDHEQNASRDQLTHHVALNQFSDLFQDELPLYDYDDGNIHAYGYQNSNSDVNIIPIEKEEDMEYFLHLMEGNDPRKQTRRRYRNHEENEEHSSPVLSPSSTSKNSTFDIPITPIWKSTRGQYGNHIVGDNNKDESSNRKLKHHHDKHLEFKSDPDDFRTYLNWATNDNPDGIPLVHPPIDQGSCGSCWAFAATGTLEAIAARRVGQETYQNTRVELQTTSSAVHIAPSSSTDQEVSLKEEDCVTSAIEAAQHAELEAFNFANLSVQELVDCDNQYDLGCTGGNPVMAFHFIHKRGLVSSARYPYLGTQGRCHHKRIKRPIATAESWGVLEPEDEENMQMVLRQFGPIAVGMNGSDKSFIHYKSGIYDSKNCDKHQNHAMLIVGYGEEKRHDGLVKYWIARNSWGSHWGENGYIRVARRNKLENSVCGISRNPSIALGATLLGSYTYKDIYTQNGNNRRNIDMDVERKRPSFSGWNKTLESKSRHPRNSQWSLRHSHPPISSKPELYIFISIVLASVFFKAIVLKRHGAFTYRNRGDTRASLVQNGTKTKAYGSTKCDEDGCR